MNLSRRGFLGGLLATTALVAAPAVARQYTVPEGLVDVRWFGALGNNFNDDTKAIQAAVDYAMNLRKGVFFPPGIYNVSSTIKISDVLKIDGAGRDVTKLRMVNL